MVIPHLLKSRTPHILNLAPPLNLNPIWFKNHTGNRGNRAAIHRPAMSMRSNNMPLSVCFFPVCLFLTFLSVHNGKVRHVHVRPGDVGRVQRSNCRQRPLASNRWVSVEQEQKHFGQKEPEQEQMHGAFW